MPTDQYPFSYEDWAKLTLSGGARQHSFPAMGAEGSDNATPVPRTGGGGGDEPEVWTTAANFNFQLDPKLLDLENLPASPTTTPVEITILDHFPSKAEMITRLTPFATPGSIFQLLIDGLNGPTAEKFKITVEDRQPLLTHVLNLPNPHTEEFDNTFEGTLQAYNDNPEVREEIGHGLFIAGVIVQLLKDQGDLANVTIRLMSVLNNKQLGLISDIAGVIRELKAFHRSDPNVQRLINCSIQVFTPFDPPLGLSQEEMRKFVGSLISFLRSAVTELGPMDILGTASDLLRGRLSLVELMAEILLGVSNIFEVGELLQLTTFLEKMPNFEIIAAAGNIPASITVDAKPLPTYPAHVHTVIGVGSLEKDALKLASFSRRSQVRETSVDGVTTLGEIVGPYIGDVSTLPIRNADNSLLLTATGDPVFLTASEIATKFDGFVKWSGTSFSTAVITGLMARLCRRGKSAEEAFKVLRGIAEQNDVTDGTSVLPILVTQA